jgi:hypothetical protein
LITRPLFRIADRPIIHYSADEKKQAEGNLDIPESVAHNSSMVEPPEQKRSRARALANLFCLFLAVLLVALFFLAVFRYRPRFEVAALSTAAFVVILLCFIQKLDPIVGALALRIYPQYPIDFQKEETPKSAPGTPNGREASKARKDLKEIERELQSLESRTDLSKLEMLDYMETMIQKQKLAAEKLKAESAEETLRSAAKERERSNE